MLAILSIVNLVLLYAIGNSNLDSDSLNGDGVYSESPPEHCRRTARLR